MDFFDKLKSSTRGYASLDYEISEYRRSKLVKMDILLNGDKVDAPLYRPTRNLPTSGQTHRWKTHSKLSLPAVRGVPIQVTVAGRGLWFWSGMDRRLMEKQFWPSVMVVIAFVSAKLLEKQKAGKKRMKAIGSVEVPQEAFSASCPWMRTTKIEKGLRMTKESINQLQLKRNPCQSRAASLLPTIVAIGSDGD